MTDIYTKNFAERFHLIRQKKGYTQAEMAEFLNCSQQTINVWENGQHTPKITMLVKIAESFNVSVDWLLGRKEQIKIVTQIPKEAETVIELYSRLNDIGKTEAEKLINLLLLDANNTIAEKNVFVS